MNRTESKLFLLYIEPDIRQKSAQPVDDEWTHFMARAVNEGKVGIADYSDPENPTSEPIFYENDRWRGTHRTPCGNYSDDQDRKLMNGMFTNSLAPFYLRWYRSAISEAEWQKIRDLHDFYVRLGFTKAIIEGDTSQEMYKEEVKTAPSQEDPKKQVPRENTFEEEAKVNFTDERVLPKEERTPTTRGGDDFILER